MEFAETTLTSLRALLSNKVRSALTMLGVIIGVFSVIVLIAVGTGMQNYITDQFENVGSNLLFVAPGKINIGSDPGNAFTRNKLADKHVDLINKYASEHLTHVSPYFGVNETTYYKTKSFFAQVFGLNYTDDTLYNYELETGRFFTKTEQKSKSRVAIIGQDVIEELFPNTNPLGKKINIKDDRFKVIGTIIEKGRNFDDNVILPYTTHAQTFDLENYSSIVLKVDAPENVGEAILQTKIALLRDLDEDDFTVMSSTDLLESITNILGIVTAGIGAIAAISLLVGGIGIMNIMLVSVTERTREIGLRKALGATPLEIALQFLIESSLLSVIGGTIGIVFSWFATFAVNELLNVRAVIPWWSVILAFSFSLFVGIVFGTYPAIKASKKDPIEALRYE